MSMNVRGVDNETQDIINFYIANGWEENEALLMLTYEAS